MIVAQCNYPRSAGRWTGAAPPHSGAVCDIPGQNRKWNNAIKMSKYQTSYIVCHTIIDIFSKK